MVNWKLYGKNYWVPDRGISWRFAGGNGENQEKL
jgi:hypothetical protein